MERQTIVDPGLAAALHRLGSLVKEGETPKPRETAPPQQEGRFDYCFRDKNDQELVRECAELANLRNGDPED